MGSQTETEYRVWAIIGPGGVVADSDFQDEAAAWRVVLGWPDADDIAAAKARGFRAVYGRFVVDGGGE
jgi:hypothetical protein